jgi:two-component system sensor histidine kinase HydH
MIIKGSLRTLANERVTREEIKQVLTDVDEEVGRLNRVVNDVLDFARPIRFDYAPADVNAVCADAEQATRADHQPMNVRLRRDPFLDHVVTDAERLRTALVNILSNARHAVAAKRSVAQDFSPAAPATPPIPDIEIITEAVPAGFRITVRDRGVGVKTEDLPRVFDPYFTTKRTGSGLGLAIAKNIVEGMGGSIALDSSRGGGTEIRLDLPVHVRDEAPARRSAQREGGNVGEAPARGGSA